MWELGGAHLHEGNLEALTWVRQIPKNKEHNISKYDKVKHDFKDMKTPSYSFGMIGWLGCWK